MARTRRFVEAVLGCCEQEHPGAISLRARELEPVRARWAKKGRAVRHINTATDDEAIGPAAVSAPINVVSMRRNPLRFISTGGQVHDSKQAEAIEGFDFELLGDKGYDSNSFRAVIALKGAEAVIPRCAPVAGHPDKHVDVERLLSRRRMRRQRCRLPAAVPRVRGLR